MLFIRLIATGIAYVSILALARWMGAAEYGAFAYAFAWINFLALPAGLGIPAASVRFLSEYSAAGSTSYIRGLLLRGVSLTVITSIAIAIAAIAIVLFDSNRIPSAYLAPLTIGIAGLPVIALFILGSQVGRAFGWVAAAYSPMQIWHPLLLLAFAGVVVGLRTPLVASTMVLASLAIAAICCVVQGTIYVRRLKPRLRNIPALYDQRRWLRVSFPLLLIDGFNALISYSDILMVGLFVGPAAVAFYTAASRTAALVGSVYGSINALSGPRMAELYAQGRTKELQNLLSGIAPWIIAPPTIAALILAVAGPFLLRLFGPGFEVAWPALVLLSFANLFNSVTGPSGLLLNMTGHQDTSARVLGIAAVGNVVLNVFFIPRFGLNGAAFATTIAIVASNIALVIIAQRKTGIRTFILPFHWHR